MPIPVSPVPVVPVLRLGGRVWSLWPDPARTVRDAGADEALISVAPDKPSGGA